jgi:hypothetical protein
MTTPEQTPDNATPARGDNPAIEAHNEFGQPLVPKAEEAVPADTRTMRKSIELPADFDYKAESVAKIAMLDNDTHPDLIGEARQLMVNSGVPAAFLAQFDSHFLIISAKGKSLLAQRTALNSFFTAEFSQHGLKAYGARQLLVQVGDHHEWIKWFRTQPLELVLKISAPEPDNNAAPAA